MWEYLLPGVTPRFTPGCDIVPFQGTGELYPILFRAWLMRTEIGNANDSGACPTVRTRVVVFCVHSNKCQINTISWCLEYAQNKQNCMVIYILLLKFGCET